MPDSYRQGERIP